jgi:hypothetical protein
MAAEPDGTVPIVAHSGVRETHRRTCLEWGDVTPEPLAAGDARQ